MYEVILPREKITHEATFANDIVGYFYDITTWCENNDIKQYTFCDDIKKFLDKVSESKGDSSFVIIPWAIFKEMKPHIIFELEEDAAAFKIGFL